MRFRALAAALAFAALSLSFPAEAPAFEYFLVPNYWHPAPQRLDQYWMPLGQPYFYPPESVYRLLRGHDAYPPPPLWAAFPEVPAAWKGFAEAMFLLLEYIPAGAFPEEYASPYTGEVLPGAEADFNGDGVPDLAEVNYFENSVTVSLRGEDGGEKKYAYRTGSGPSATVAADFSGDGIPDLAITNAGSNTVTVFIGTGNGGFAFLEDYRTGTAPKAVAAADVDGDAVLDLITANFEGRSVSFLAGTGDGTFKRAREYAVSGSPKAIAVADFDKDGFMDVAVSDWLGSKVCLLMGDGKGGFRQGAPVAAGHTPESLAAADLDLDGNLDIVVSSVMDENAGVLYGKGDGTFRPHREVGPFADPGAVAPSSSMADLDVSFDPEMGSVKPERGSYAPGTVVRLDATPKPGYKFIGWEGPVKENDLLITTIKVLKNEKVSAIFEPE